MKKIFYFILFFVSIWCFSACEDETTVRETTYLGTVINAIDHKPFPNLEVSVTNGESVYKTTHTDVTGLFSILVRTNEINSNYYILIGDSSCLPVKKELKGLGREEIDLGIIEVEGPKAPSVKLVDILEPSAYSVKCIGDITNDGRSAVFARGFVWSKHPYPTLLNDEHLTCGKGTVIKNLLPDTEYYIRAYAINGQDSAYSDPKTIKTKIVTLGVTTDTIKDVTSTSATIQSFVQNTNGLIVTSRGVCWATSPFPAFEPDHTFDGNGDGQYESHLTNLKPNTTYWVRAYATTPDSIFYGNQLPFKTNGPLPKVNTIEVKDTTSESATIICNISDDENEHITARGVCWSNHAYPDTTDNRTYDGEGKGEYESHLTNLEQNTTYYVCAYATNASGTAYGNQLSFSTKNGLAEVITVSVSDITKTSAVCSAEVKKDNGRSVTERGICWSTKGLPTIEDSPHISNGLDTGFYSCPVTNLLAATTYYVRAYATNSAGTAYGQSIPFTTSGSEPTVTTGSCTLTTCTSALLHGTINSDGGSTIEKCGFIYQAEGESTIDSILSAIINTDFTAQLTNLKPNTKYFVTAYAKNATGFGYGKQTSFTTNNGLKVTTGKAQDIGSTSAIVSGEIISDGAYKVQECGICYSSSVKQPSLNDMHTVIKNVTNGSFSCL